MSTDYESPIPGKLKCRSAVAFNDIVLNGEQLASAIHCHDTRGHQGEHHANVTACDGQVVYLEWEAKGTI